MYPESIENAIQPAWKTTSTAPTPNIKKKKGSFASSYAERRGVQCSLWELITKCLAEQEHRGENFSNSFKENFCCSDSLESLSKAHVLKVQWECWN